MSGIVFEGTATSDLISLTPISFDRLRTDRDMRGRGERMIGDLAVNRV